jgi:broad specificity phosphatase PhoE
MEEQKWPSELVVVRHGESERNVGRQAARRAGVFDFGAGLRDVDARLTPLGERQAEATGRALGARHRFDRILASPYERTRGTAARIALGLGYEVETVEDERIREREFGVLDGLTPAGVRDRFPAEWDRRNREKKYYYRPPAGESGPDVALRVHSFLGTLTRDYRRQSVLVVTHSVVVLVFRKLLERLTEEDFLHIDATHAVFNCSATTYRFDPAGAGKLLRTGFNEVLYPLELASESDREEIASARA